MNRKLKLALAALLGFSAACSTVKNTSKGDKELAQETAADSTQNLYHVIVMYGVRPPAGVGYKDIQNRTDSLGPVLESPKDDAPVLKPRVSAQSTVDPVAEKPSEE